MQEVKTKKQVLLSKFTEIKDLEQGKKIKDIGFSKIIELVTEICIIVGASEKSQPSHEMQQRIVVNNIRTAFPYLTPLEIKKAFLWAIEGRFDTNGQALDLKLYDQVFSINYMSPVVKRYIAYKNRVKTEVQHIKEQQARDQERKTDEEIHEILKSGVVHAFNEYRKKGRFIDAGSPVYNYLNRAGHIDENVVDEMKVCELIEEDVEKEMSMARTTFERRLIKKKKGNMGEFLESLDGQNSLTRHRRYLAVQEFFEKVIKEGGGIEGYL